MLILTRYPGQGIIIDDQIVVRILKNEGREVSIGIDAPKHIKINREEVQQRIDASLLDLPSQVSCKEKVA